MLTPLSRRMSKIFVLSRKIAYKGMLSSIFGIRCSQSAPYPIKSLTICALFLKIALYKHDSVLLTLFTSICFSLMSQFTISRLWLSTAKTRSEPRPGSYMPFISLGGIVFVNFLSPVRSPASMQAYICLTVLRSTLKMSDLNPYL